jgi:hypothetical protein
LAKLLIAVNSIVHAKITPGKNFRMVTATGIERLQDSILDNCWEDFQAVTIHHLLGTDARFQNVHTIFNDSNLLEEVIENGISSTLMAIIESSYEVGGRNADFLQADSNKNEMQKLCSSSRVGVFRT